MITPDKAHEIINETTPSLNMEKLKLSDLTGKIIAQDIRATRDQPPFDRVMMDGIAVNSKCRADQTLAIESTCAAGEKQGNLVNITNGCIEVMTGAPLPKGTDCVIPIEKIIKADGGYEINQDFKLSPFKFVHQWGTDYKQDEILIAHGTKLTPPHIGIIASNGLTGAQTYKMDRVAIVSTGSELISPGQEIEDHQIYLSNSFALESLLNDFGYNCEKFHFNDEVTQLEESLKNILDQYKIIIITGGVSKGKFDFIPEILSKLNVEKHFHGILQKPGKPMWYGTYQQKAQVFGLPGNPISCLVCARKYILKRKTQVELNSEIEYAPNLTLFKPVKINNGKAEPISFNTSGDFNALGNSTGFLELAAEKSKFAQGEIYNYYSWTD